MIKRHDCSWQKKIEKVLEIDSISTTMLTLVEDCVIKFVDCFINKLGLNRINRGLNILGGC